MVKCSVITAWIPFFQEVLGTKYRLHRFYGVSRSISEELSSSFCIYLFWLMKFYQYNIVLWVVFREVVWESVNDVNKIKKQMDNLLSKNGLNSSSHNSYKVFQ